MPPPPARLWATHSPSFPPKVNRPVLANVEATEKQKGVNSDQRPSSPSSPSPCLLLLSLLSLLTPASPSSPSSPCLHSSPLRHLDLELFHPGSSSSHDPSTGPGSFPCTPAPLHPCTWRLARGSILTATCHLGPVRMPISRMGKTEAPGGPMAQGVHLMAPTCEPGSA